MLPLPGALHIHTTYSDGSGSVSEVIAAAQQAGLRWIIITDHDTLAAAPFAGYHGDLLVIVGHEITPDRNHFLAFNLDAVVDNQLAPQAFIDEVYARGGFGVIAHPDEQVKNRFKDIYRWDDWQVDGPSLRVGRTVGIELWNFMSDWAEHLSDRNQLALVARPRLGLSGPSPATLAWWDELNQQGKRTFGCLGVDVHAFKHKVPWGKLEIFPYRWTFGTLTNYLQLGAALAPDAATATAQVYAALAAGQHYGLNRLEGECANLLFEARRGDERYPIGATASLAQGPLTIMAETNSNATLRLIGNGQALVGGIGALRQTITEPGVYRLEAYHGGKAWLFSNPIFVEAGTP